MKKINVATIVMIGLLGSLHSLSQETALLQKLPALNEAEVKSIEKNLHAAILREAVTRKHGQFSVLILSGQHKAKKQTAARYLAQKTQAEIYKVDLSMAVSGNPGETEKNLRLVFESVKNKTAVLFFDEADALFGKRNALQDSHDRYDNQGTNYFMRLVKKYRGSIIISITAENSINPLIFEKFVKIAP